MTGQSRRTEKTLNMALDLARKMQLALNSATESITELSKKCDAQEGRFTKLIQQMRLVHGKMTDDRPEGARYVLGAILAEFEPEEPST